MPMVAAIKQVLEADQRPLLTRRYARRRQDLQHVRAVEEIIRKGKAGKPMSSARLIETTGGPREKPDLIDVKSMPQRPHFGVLIAASRKRIKRCSARAATVSW